jgi:hypothetical protein
VDISCAFTGDVGAESARGSFCCCGNPIDKRVDCFRILSTRQYEAPIVRLPGSIGVHRLIDHEITAVALDDALEALDGIEQLDKLLISLSACEMNAERAQTERHLGLDASPLVTCRVGSLLLVAAEIVRHEPSAEK